MMRALPGTSHRRAVLDAVKDACGAARAVASLRAALLDSLCARRDLSSWPGRRNGARPNKETEI
jgi:hypothetical protein